ncbi:hypothetical protein KI387_041761, partial [Taxus chinensis]
LNVEYVVTLLDIRHTSWADAVVTQFYGTLDRDGLCRIRPGFSMALEDKHLDKSWVLCKQVLGIDMLPDSVYTTIGCLSIYRYVNTMDGCPSSQAKDSQRDRGTF